MALSLQLLRRQCKSDAMVPAREPVLNRLPVGASYLPQSQWGVRLLEPG